MTMFRLLRPGLLLLSGLYLAACRFEPSAPPEVHAARLMLPPPGGTMAAGYFELHNPGRQALVLNRVSSRLFEAIDMHETVDADGVLRMREIERVTVPAGQTLRFESGGRHLMLTAHHLPEPVPNELPLVLELRTEDGQLVKIEALFAVERAGGVRDASDRHEHHLRDAH